jgi:phenylalanyl-tRNA synthetase beta chain
MNVIYKDRQVQTPDLTPKKKEVSVSNAAGKIGIDLTAEEVVDFLGKVRIGAEIKSEDTVEAVIPPYRIDILHEVDIIENIAIGYCFKKIGSELPEIATIAEEDKDETFDNVLREILVGMGFIETMSLMLTSEKVHYKNMRLPEDERVTVAQPISTDRTMLRKNIFTGPNGIFRR